MAQPSMADLQKQIAAAQHKIAILERATSQMIDKFALFWIDDHKPPAFSIVVKKNGTKADLIVFSQHLSTIDLRFNKELVETDEPKAGRWEPMILPLGLLGAVIQQEAAETKRKTAEEVAEEQEPVESLM